MADASLLTSLFPEEVVTRALVRDVELPDGAGTMALITLDNGLDHTRPSTFGPAGLLALNDALDAVAARTDIAAVGVTGKPFIFAVGADLSGAPLIAARNEALTIARLGHAVFRRLGELSVPSFAFVNGAALGGGLELALCADFRVLGESAKVGQPEILLGLIPGAGGTQRLPRLIGPAKAKDLIFTGRFADAAEALAIGLADKVVPDEQVYPTACEMASRYANGPAIAIAAAKRAIDAGLDCDLDTGLEFERISFAGMFATEDAKAGMRSFLENGPGKAVFSGS